MPDSGDTPILQVFRRELRQNGFVHRVVAESGLVLLKAKAPQPHCHVHDGSTRRLGRLHHRPRAAACPGRGGADARPRFRGLSGDTALGQRLLDQCRGDFGGLRAVNDEIR